MQKCGFESRIRVGSCLVTLVTLFAAVLVLFLVLGFSLAIWTLVLRGLIGVGLLMIQGGEDQVKDLVIPARWTPFDTLFDVL